MTTFDEARANAFNAITAKRQEPAMTMTTDQFTATLRAQIQQAAEDTLTDYGHVLTVAESGNLASQITEAMAAIFTEYGVIPSRPVPATYCRPGCSRLHGHRWSR